MNSIKTILVIFISCLMVESRCQSIQSQLDQYMSDVRNSTRSVNLNDLLKNENAIALLDAVQIYYTDSLSRVRARSYELTKQVGIKSDKLETRQLATARLASCHRDPNAGNLGQLWCLLSKFRVEDFTVEAKDSLKNSFRNKPAHMDQLMKLMGYLEMNDMKEAIRALTLPPNSKRDRWAALLALSRMGDDEAIQSVMQRSQKLKVNDDVVYEIFPDLIYTRQSAPINYLITVLNSDDKNCFAADGESETRIPCAYRAMEQLAPVIEGYPVRLDASGDVVASNYEKALADVRKWFAKNGQSYKISKTVF